MQVTRETLQKIARLSRLEVSEAETPELLGTLESVLTWMEQLNEVNTDGIEPLTAMSASVNALRPDVAQLTITTEQGLANAPAHDGTYFRVPKMVE